MIAGVVAPPLALIPMGYEAHSRDLVHKNSKKLGAIHTVFVCSVIRFMMIMRWVDSDCSCLPPSI